MRKATVAASLVVFGLGAVAACGDDGGAESPTFCHADGLIGPQGQTYGRDPGQDCQFVDARGRPITTDRTGAPLCGEPTVTHPDCE